MNFFNFEDPEVLAKLTGPDYEMHWKRVYGFDFVTKLPNNTAKVDIDQSYDVDSSPVAIHCVESEFR